MAKPRILLYDIETFANKIYAWGKYEQNAIAYDQHWYMISFAYKWLDEKQTHVVALPDFPKVYKKDGTNDVNLVHALWKLFDEADVVIGHNSKKFDNKKSNARFVKHGMRPPSPYQTVDTRDVAKRYFRFDSNKLDDLGDYLGVGRKINTGGFDLWLGCERGEKKSWDLMKKYNKQDVELLERVYKKLLPFMNNHANLGLLSGNARACPNCGSLHLVQQGFRPTRTRVMQQFQCRDCGAWSSAPKETAQVR